MSEESKVNNGYKWLVEHMTSKGMGYTLAKIIAGAIIGALAALGLMSCETITTTQIHAVHGIYHQVTDNQCIFVTK